MFTEVKWFIDGENILTIFLSSEDVKITYRLILMIDQPLKETI